MQIWYLEPEKPVNVEIQVLGKGDLSLKKTKLHHRIRELIAEPKLSVCGR